jgi:hypothetical protein
MSMVTIKTLVCVTLALAVLGCTSRNSEVVPTPRMDKANVSILPGQTPDEAAIEKMLAAKEALFTKLSGRLMEAMGTQGPAAAIAVCKTEARQIADAVGEEHGLRIGRAGVRLRNPNNTAPSWAENLVHDKTATPTFVTLDNEHAAALLPIKLQSQCLMCHGPDEQIAPVIQDQLTKLYPTDAATGFKEGELRGWFWVELPNRQNPIP